MNYAYFEGVPRQKLWEECTKFTTELEEILIQKKQIKATMRTYFGQL